MMRLRRNRIAKSTMGVVMVALIVALCVPHHHHEDAVCFGNADCKAEHKHSHHDECGSQGMHGVCPLVAQYVDTRNCIDGPDYSRNGDCNYLLASGIVAMLLDCNSEADVKTGYKVAYLPHKSVLSTPLRSPPSVNS